MKTILSKLKKYSLLLATSCLLIVASDSAGLLSTPSAILTATPTSNPASNITASQDIQTLQIEIEKKKLTVSERALFSAPGSYQRKSNTTKEYAEGEIAIKFKPDTSENKRAEIISKYNGKIRSVLQTGTRILTGIETGREKQILEELKLNPDVEYADLIGVVSQQEIGSGGSGASVNPAPPPQCGTPNDEWYCNNYQHNLVQISASVGWWWNKGSSSTIIAILDSGIDYNHPDLDQKIWKNQAELQGNANQDDDGNGYVDD
ncbi:MAG: hypothetical protein AAB895_02910, partial [Patescibacteria group bacterium]